MAKKVFDFNEHRRKAVEKMKQVLGKPEVPSWENRLSYWKEKSKNMPPRSFMFVYDFALERTVLSRGLSVLGYPDNKELNAFDLIGMIHENHRLLFGIQVYRIHEAMLQFDYEDIGLDYFTSGLRAIKDAHGKYWLAHYTSESFQFDKNGKQVRHLTHFKLLSPYKGEPLYVDFYHRNQKEHHLPLKKIKRILEIIKSEQLTYLEFSKTQQEVIKLHAINCPIEGILETLDIKQTTLNEHHYKILKNGKEKFPINDFRVYKDVVDYIIKHDLVYNEKYN